MTWLPDDAAEAFPRSLGIWEPLPDGYNPVAPVVAPGSLTLPLQTRILPLLVSAHGAPPPFRDPRIGVFVPDAMPNERDLLAGNTYYRNPFMPYYAHPFRIGVDAIGDPDARIGGDRIPPMHGPLPNDTVQSDWPSVEVVLP